MKYGNFTGIFNRISALTIATIFTLTSVASAAVPIFLTQTASATSTTWVEVPFTASEISDNWKKDRSAPSGGANSVSFEGRDNVLELGIDIEGVNTAGVDGFYQTEGLQKQISPSNTIRADLYVDSDWTNNEKMVRAGLWGVAKNEVGTIQAYPIVEFTTVDGAGWRVWNSEGSWSSTNSQYNIDAWNTLEITQNHVTATHDYRVNGELIGSTPDMGSVQIEAVIINNKNFGEPTQNYDVRWSNFAYGNNPDTANKNVLRVSGSLYRDFGLNDCDNKTECENRTNDMLADWEVRLYKEGSNENWELIKTGFTNEDGKFNLGSHQYAGRYHVCEVVQDGWTQQIQNWSGSGYLVNTPNDSDSTDEGPYCATTIYTDEGDRSWPSKFGNVDITAPLASDVAVTPLSANNVTGKIVKVEFTLSDANEIDFRKSATHVRFMAGKDNSGKSISSGTYAVVKNEGEENRYHSIIDTTDFVPNGSAAESFHIYIRSQDKVGSGNATASSFYEGQNRIDVDNTAPNGEFDVPAGIQNKTVVISVNLTDPGQSGLGVQQIVLKDQNGTTVGNWIYNVVTGTLRVVKGNGTASYEGDAQSGRLSIDFDTSDLNGTYNLRLFTKDQLSNGRSNIYGAIHLDNANPVITSPALTDRAINSTDGNPTLTATVNGTGSDVAYAQYRIHTAAGQKVDDHGWVNLEATDGIFDSEIENITKTMNVSGLDDGDYLVRIRAFDAAENKKSGIDLNFVIDRSAPVLTLNNMENGTEKPTITGTVDDASATVKILVDDAEYDGVIETEQNEDGTYNWTATITGPLADGDHPVVVTATDLAGNESEEQTGTLTVALEPATNRSPNAPNQQTGRATDNAPDRLVVTTFNTNNPDVLGVTNADDTTDTDPPVEGEVESAAITSTDDADEAEKELVESTEASTTWYWAIAMVALLGAVFFGYRNFKSYNKNN